MDRTTGGEDHHVYAFSLLVSDENEHAQEFLRRIGLTASDRDMIFPGWTFWVAEAKFHGESCAEPRHLLVVTTAAVVFAASWPLPP